MKLPPIIREAAILSVAAIVLALTVNALSPAGISLACCFKAPSLSDDSRFQTIDVSEARRMLEAGEAVFVDARSAEQYKDGHIPGACSLPVYQMDDCIFPFLDKVRSDATVVTYCSSVSCEDSHLLAEQLVDMGYEKVMIFAGGISAWQEAGNDVAAK